MTRPRGWAFTAAVSFALAAACGRRDARSTARVDTAVAVHRPAPAGTTTDYVGLQYDVLPEDFHFEGGAVLPPVNGGLAGSFDFAHVKTPRGDMIWLDTLGPATSRGLPNRIVRAELRVPPLSADERLFMGSCDAGGKVDPRIVAIAVNPTNAARSEKVRQAWRANPSAARFDLIPVRGISCEEPGA
jgi:hypothetical protein